MDDFEKFLKEQTFEEIQSRQLAAYPPEYDKREGSVAWDIFAPFSLEERLLFIQMLWMWRNMFGDTAERESLKRIAQDRDVTILSESAAVVEGEFNVFVGQGMRFNYEDLNYVVTKPKESKEGLYYAEMRCEQMGKVGNVSGVDLIPMDNITGLVHARITRILVPGEDEEDTEAFRERYYETIRNKDYGFNISEYVHQVKAMPGVGMCRVYPATPEPGHVTIYLIDSNGNPGSESLVQEVQETLDPVPYNQMGLGRAPIGHYVHVKSAAVDKVNLVIRVQFGAGIAVEAIKAIIREKIGAYFQTLASQYEEAYSPIPIPNAPHLTVRESFVETAILEANHTVPGAVVDASVEMIGGSPGNHDVIEDGIPVLGTITYSEVSS